MKVAVLGLGYVGITAAACLAKQGHHVVGVDPNPTKVLAVLAGQSPIIEPGVGELLAEGRSRGLITACTMVDQTVIDCDLVMVCVGTPSAVNGSHDLTFVAEVSRQLAEALADHPTASLTVAYRSTMRPGTMEELIEPIFGSFLGEEAERVELVHYPEFTRESSAVQDYFEPPKIVIGTRTGAGCPTLEKINEGIDAPVFHVRYRESEMTKFLDNSFHAVKTVFANEIGRLCAQLGISAATVHDIFVSDTKLNISSAYLRPGGPFGGSCLPKDVRALQHISQTCGGSTHLLDSLIASNEAHKGFLFDHVTRGLPSGALVLLLGISFKRDSDDLRESPNIDLARMLIADGYQLSIFDPHVTPENLMGEHLGVLSDAPFIRKLLVEQSMAEETRWNLVIDSRSCAEDYAIEADRVVDVNRLA